MKLPAARPGAQPLYPWASMEVGDQFFVKATDGEDARNRQQRLCTLGIAFGKRTGKKFATRRVPGGVRVFRIK